MSSSSYYQENSTTSAPLHTEQATNDNSDPSDELPPAWSFSDTNKTRLLSRDGSEHVTDEVFNSLSHMSAAMISVLGMVLLIAQSGGDAWKIVSFSIYGASLIFLFVCSTLHHAISSSTEVSF